VSEAANQPALRLDRKTYAVIVLLVGIGIGNIQDAFLKELSGAYPFHEMQTVRTAIGLILLLAIVANRLGLRALATHYSPVLLTRGLFLGIGSMFFYLGLAAMTLADAVALYFALPLIMVVLSGTVIGERVRLSHWIAAAVGFSGVLIMLNPTSGLFEWAGLLPLTASVFYALGNMLTRKVDENVPPLITATYAAMSFLAVAGLLALVFGSGVFETNAHPSLAFLTKGWAMPGLRDAMVMGVVGAFTLVGFFAYAEAYRSASPSFLGPFEYSAMVWAAGLGFLFFGDIPSARTLIGSLIIIGAGLFLALDERRRTRR
jgi:drug/metabolite transporter (DMT)-like permease